MKVTLKKAAALSAALLAVKVPLSHQFGVDIYANPPTQEGIDNAEKAFAVQLSNASTIIAMGYSIRRQIGEANVGRINELLTFGAMIDKQIALYNSVPVREQGTNLDALLAKMAAMKEGKEAGVGRYLGDALTIGLKTSDTVLPALRLLRKQRREIDDELQQLNFTTTIELPDDVVKVLTDLDLI